MRQQSIDPSLMVSVAALLEMPDIAPAIRDALAKRKLKPISKRRVHTFAELLELLSISESSLKRLLRAGLIRPPIYITARRAVFLDEDVQNFLDRAREHRDRAIQRGEKPSFMSIAAE